MKCLKNLYKNQLLFVLTCIVCMSCSLAESQQSSSSTEVNQKQAPKNLNPQPAAENYSAYLSYLKDKKIALVVNHTSMIGTKHLDLRLNMVLQALPMRVKKYIMMFIKILILLVYMGKIKNQQVLN